MSVLDLVNCNLNRAIPFC